MSCAQRDLDLDAYIDRELDTEGAARVRDHLAGCADCRTRVAEREQLARLVRATPYFAAPARLRASVAGAARRRASLQRLSAWAAAAVLVLSVGAGLMLVRVTARRADTAAEEAVNEHVRSLMAQHLFDVRSTDQHTVKPWFLGKLDFAPPVADLAGIGFPLVGGRLDYLDGRPAAALVYERRLHTINVFILPAGGSPDRTANDARSIRGFQVHHWTRRGMAFWAVSDLNDAELSRFVAALQAQ
jgi:anti-sigma factor RsiW